LPDNILLTDLLNTNKDALKIDNANIDIALSALRDAITKTGETVKTLADIVDKLSDVGVTSLPSLVAGSNIVGKVGIDQTTGGITNGVVNKNASGTEIFTDANPGSIKLTGSNVEQTIGQAVPAKANLIGISDGTNIRAMLGNVEGTLLASAARTATVNTPNQINYNAKGVMVFVNVSAVSGTGGLTLNFYGIDPVSGQYIGLMYASGAITAIGRYAYVIYPGVSSSAITNGIRQVAGITLPRTWLVQVAVGDASSYSYSVAYSLIV